MNRTITISKQNIKYQAYFLDILGQQECPSLAVNRKLTRQVQVGNLSRSQLELHQLCLALSHLGHSGHRLWQCVRCLKLRRKVHLKWTIQYWTQPLMLEEDEQGCLGNF